MDAVKFLKEQARMCKFYSDCRICPIGSNLVCVDITDDGLINRKIAIVEKWAKEHPVKTRMSEFLKHFPNAPLKEDDGLPTVCPCNLEPGYFERRCAGTSCIECRKKYWLEEIE